MCSSHSILECIVMFSGVKLSMGSFVLFMRPKSSKSAKPFLRYSTLMTEKAKMLLSRSFAKTEEQ